MELLWPTQSEKLIAAYREIGAAYREIGSSDMSTR